MTKFTGAAIQLESLGFKRIPKTRMYELKTLTGKTTVNMFTGEITGPIPNELRRKKLIVKVK